MNLAVLVLVLFVILGLVSSPRAIQELPMELPENPISRTVQCDQGLLTVVVDPNPGLSEDNHGIWVSTADKIKLTVSTYSDTAKAPSVDVWVEADRGRFVDTENATVQSKTGEDGKFRVIWYAPPKENNTEVTQDVPRTYTITIRAFDVAKQGCQIALKVIERK